MQEISITMARPMDTRTGDRDDLRYNRGCLQDIERQYSGNLRQIRRNIVTAKINAGQLDNADISLKDLSRIKSVLKSYLGQIYHDRIAYPKQER